MLLRADSRDDVWVLKEHTDIDQYFLRSMFRHKYKVSLVPSDESLRRLQ
jgi:hypothetical protein